MCFCASASFAAAGGLAVIGAASLGQAKKEQRLIAAIPLLFAVQQLIEGGQWIVPHPSTASLLLGYAFLIFAFLVWPTYVPYAIYRLEKNSQRKRVLRWFIGAGIITTLGLIFTLFTQPLIVQILPKGIDYHILPPFAELSFFWYVATVCGSLMISSQKAIRWLGLAALVSSALSLWFFLETFTSVWCFFAAILSVAVYFFIRQKNNTKR